MLASLREWVLNETGVEQRDAAYNAIHVGTWFVRSLGAVFAQNRLLKGGARKRADRRLSPEIGFHAIGAAAGTTIALKGYEDVKSRFYGLGPTNAPDSLLGLGAPARPERRRAALRLRALRQSERRNRRAGGRRRRDRDSRRLGARHGRRDRNRRPLSWNGARRA